MEKSLINLGGFLIMKNYTITVNGNVYEVTVEEGVSTGAATAAPQAVRKAAPASAEGAVKVAAPMPGKILAVKASAGQAVKKGDVLLVLEAMKMENDIVAPQDGTVASINAAAGDSVEAGVTLATLN